MTTKAKPLRGAHTVGGFVTPFRLSTDSRSALGGLGWTDAMLTELDRRVEGARFDTSVPMPTFAQMAAALEQLGQAAGKLEAELRALDQWTGHVLDVQIDRHLSDLEIDPWSFRRKLAKEAMALQVLIHSMLRHTPKTKRGPRGNRLAIAVAKIVREIMVGHGQEPTQGGSAAAATEVVQRELGILHADTPRHSIRRAARPTAPRR